ncbi:MAG: putative DNA-binding domain-containing protein [Phycisphaerae bacterium]
MKRHKQKTGAAARSKPRLEPPLAARRPKPPRRVASQRDLLELQRSMLAAVCRPLTPRFHMQQHWVDGSPMKAYAGKFMKPNDRLTSFERLEIYNRQYWFRLLDCLYEDFPGLQAILGEQKFNALCRAYLTRYPSNSFMLRNLGDRLEQFVLKEPHWLGRHQRLGSDMIRFEWGQIVAFDEPAIEPISAQDIAGANPAKLRMSLQPYVVLLELAYPLDEFSVALKKQRSVRTEAGEAERQHAGVKEPVPLPKPHPTLLAIHRVDNSVYYKRLEPAAFALLNELRRGRTLLQACAAAAIPELSPQDMAAKFRDWFAIFAQLGWLCRRQKSRVQR